MISAIYPFLFSLSFLVKKKQKQKQSKNKKMICLRLE